MDAYEQKEGIRLDESKIEKNPGLRSLAKMMLNSFWGKLDQQGNKCQVVALTSSHEFYKLIISDDQVIHSIRVVTEDMLEVVYSNIDAYDPIQHFLARFTTCWVRLKLYEGIKQLLLEQVLHFDTNSPYVRLETGSTPLAPRQLLR